MAPPVKPLAKTMLGVAPAAPPVHPAQAPARVAQPVPPAQPAPSAYPAPPAQPVSPDTPLRPESQFAYQPTQQAPVPPGAQQPAPAQRPLPAQPAPAAQLTPQDLNQKLPPDSPLRPGPPPEDQWVYQPEDESSRTHEGLPPPVMPQKTEPTAPDTPLKLAPTGAGIPGLAPFDDDGIPIAIGTTEEPAKPKKKGRGLRLLMGCLIVIVVLSGAAFGAVLFGADEHLVALRDYEGLIAKYLPVGETQQEPAKAQEEKTGEEEKAGTEEAKTEEEPPAEETSAGEEPPAEEETAPAEEPPAEKEPAAEQPKPQTKKPPKPKTTTPKPPKPKPPPKTTYPTALSTNLPDKPSKDEVKAALMGVQPKVNACGQGERGLATVSIKVAGATGKVTKAKVVGGTFKGTPQAACIEKAVKKAKFLRFQQKSISFSYPFVIK